MTHPYADETRFDRRPRGRGRGGHRFGPDGAAFSPGATGRRRDEFPSVPADENWMRGDGPARRGRGGGRGAGRGGSGFDRGPGFDRGGPGGPGFGPGGHRGRGRRGGRAGRGDVRAAILLLLVDQPMHGYQLIQQIAERSGGIWQPSPGAVYPALNLLADEGLVEIEESGGRRMASLTEAGRTYLTEHADEIGNPWQDAAGRGHGRHRELRSSLESVGSALREVVRTGSDAQIDQAAAILTRARRDLYLVLAGTDDAEANVAVPSAVRDYAADAPGANPAE